MRVALIPCDAQIHLRAWYPNPAFSERQRDPLPQLASHGPLLHRHGLDPRLQDDLSRFERVDTVDGSAASVSAAAFIASTTRSGSSS